jgi:hypothetical protein
MDLFLIFAFCGMAILAMGQQAEATLRIAYRLLSRN